MAIVHPTFSDLIQRCLVELRLESGISVQQYSEDVIAAILQRQFNTFFDHYWWPSYMQGQEFTLNGHGYVVEPINDYIRRLEDIRYMWIDGDEVPLNMAPPMRRPNTSSGFRPTYYPAGQTTDNLFWISPTSTVGKLFILSRFKPMPFLPNDPVKLDGDLLVMATCYNYLADDEDSPSATKKFAEAAGKREGQLREMMNKGPIPISSFSSSIPNTWMMSP